MTEELLPCPFCGATDGDLVQAFTRATADFAFWSVECLRCGVEVASDASQAEADQHWNQRHHQADHATLERVARALMPFSKATFITLFNGPHGLEEKPSRGAYDATRAAIAAMREDR